MNQPPKLYSQKELAALLGRSYKYVNKMRARGFKMAGERATIEDALRWLSENPRPCGLAYRAPRADQVLASHTG